MGRVLIVGFEGAQTLDVMGPAEVFAAACRQVGRPVYRVELLSSGGGERTLSSSLVVRTRPLCRARRGDLVVVSGGDDPAIRAAIADPKLLRWLRRARVRRMSSVCSGAF